MMKRIFLLCTMSSLVFSCVENDKAKVVDGWTILFDGSSYKQWRGFQNMEVPEEWIIEDDAMAYVPGNQGGKTIITKNRYTNFTLSLEWKISKGGNSGIFWGVGNDEKYSVAYQTGPEIQIRDNEIRPGTLVLKVHRSGAIFDVLAPSEDVANPIGEWNQCIIDIDHNVNEGIVILNGKEILKFPVHGNIWKQLVDNSKFKDWEDFGNYKTGYIGLQDHGNSVWYRNIKNKIK